MPGPPSKSHFSLKKITGFQSPTLHSSSSSHPPPPPPSRVAKYNPTHGRSCFFFRFLLFLFELQKHSLTLPFSCF
ncbi:hypothetical protein IC575_002248 [Cucumis melo]